MRREMLNITIDLTPRISVLPIPRKITSLDTIRDFEKSLIGLPQVDVPVEHDFGHNIYSRKVTMPAGSIITSKLHMRDHFAVVLRGLVDVWEPNGPKRRLKAGDHFKTRAGTKRILHVIEETEWITFHGTEQKTPEAVEREIIEPEDHLLPQEADTFDALQGVYA